MDPDDVYRPLEELTPLARRALDAYGGAERWRRAVRVRARADVGGLLLRWKRQRLPGRLEIDAEVRRPAVRVRPIGRRGRTGVLEGRDVRLEDRSGAVVAKRADARRFFPYGRRLFRWDNLDLTYFVGYAQWQYLTFPALLMRRDLAWTEQDANVLEVIFPPEVPSHSRVQRYYFDAESGLLTGLWYTPDVFGISRIVPTDEPVHFIREHSRTSDGVPYPSLREIGPEKAPNLVVVRHEDLRLSSS